MDSRTLQRLLLKSILLLLAGWAIYSFQRMNYYPHLLQLHPGTESLNSLPEFMKNNLPSLLHVWAMSLLTAVAMPAVFLRNRILAPGLWLSINIIFECGQGLDKQSKLLQQVPEALSHYFIQGRFDWFDLVACVLGACLAMWTLGESQSSSVHVSKFRSRCLTVACTIFGLFSIMATSKRGDYQSAHYTGPYKPIYMSYEEFRASFAVLPPQPIAAPGKIYVKDQLLLISDINLGVHIVDNQNPSEPKPLSFLKILGSKDMAVFDHYLYVDSFVDFLVIDIADPAAPRLVQRVEDIYPWQPEVWFPGQYIDANREGGVIVGFESNTTSSKQEN